MEQRPFDRITAVALATLVAVAGCGGQEPPPVAVPVSPPPSALPAVTTDPAVALPAPNEVIPKEAARLAEALETTADALYEAVEEWTEGDSEKPPQDVELLALYHQRILRYAARHPKVATKAFAKLPRTLAAQSKDEAEAIRELLALARPIKGSATFKVQPPLPAADLLRHFKKAERRFGVEWEVLAAVMLAETKFGRVKSASHAGAQGPMQFMPATWKAYGLGGDIQNPRDAVMGAANYLRATGAPGDYQRALHAYNPSQAYVDAILLHARQIKRDVRNYYVYYNWQVFVLTTDGERRLTGP